MAITTLRDFLTWAERSFEEAGLFFGHGTDNAWDEACAIARFVLELPPDASTDILDIPLSEDAKVAMEQLVEKRLRDRTPVPYLTHEAWFAGLKFYVDERVLIPRSPLGELIIKKFQPWIGQKPVTRILDLCTGGGCIAIACAHFFPEAIVDAIDLSEAALQVAVKNLKLHNIENRVNLIQADLFEKSSGQHYDIIISNPPYVNRQEFENLPAEYQWEPKLALIAGEDGLMIVHRILREASNFLTEQGILIVEVGSSEATINQKYPHIPFTWLEFEWGGEGVFLLNAEDKECWQIF